MKKLAIMGLGLMGASLGLTVRRRGLAETVCGYARRAEIREAAVARGVVDIACASPEEAVRDADVVVFCVPILAIEPLAAACRGAWRPGCLVTDVGSTKAGLVASMEKTLAGTGGVFVGSHPIAGSEETGMDAARDGLYEGAMVIVTTPTPASVDAEAAVGQIRHFWTDLGARVTVMSPDDHDRILAATSHLPHLVASALVECVLGEHPRHAVFCGTGFRDSTRIAAGSDDVWHDIILSNRDAIREALGGFRDVLSRVEESIRKGDFEDVRAMLARNRQRRLNMEQGGS